MKTRIMVIDDEPHFTFMLKKFLELNGHYNVREVNDSSTAMNAAREFAPDIILLDIMMPDPDGSEVAAALRNDPQTRDVPILYLTALVSQAEACDARFGLDRQHYLPKPVNFVDLIRHIEDTCFSGERSIS